jgi:ABC-type Fe3+/spermidine/putrescine transport system ATPase subunit
MVAITVRHLSKNFGGTPVLRDIDLKIEAGEMFFLLGPSGCGKTTLLRHIAGFYQQDSGHVLFDARDMTGVPAHQRNTAMMFQSYALWPHLTVAQNVAFGLEERKLPKPEIKQRVQEALDMVQMGLLGPRKINQLSGGQQQRVALARSLAVRPDCLLLDEPLSNLDAKLRLEMRGEIRRICKRFGLTSIYVTHDQKEALHLADRMAIMEKGTLSQVGTPRNVYKDPVSAGVASFIGEANFLPGTFAGATSRSGLHAVKTADGEFWGRITDAAWQPKTGEKVQLCIRPESLRFVPRAEPRNTMAGKITESIYLGEVAQYTVTGSTGPALQLTELNPAALHESGGACIVAAEPEDVMILRP